MRKFLVLILLLLISGSVRSQDGSERIVSGAKSVEDYRPIGDTRVWTFTSKNNTFGRLISRVERRGEVDGQEALFISQDLSLDYTKIGGTQIIETKGEFAVSEDGAFLSTELYLTIDSVKERLKLTRKGNALTGYYTRGGEEIQQEIPLAAPLFVWETNMVDQLELLLAMREVGVGDTLRDSIFQPQSMMVAPLFGYVAFYTYKELWVGKFDSVFTVGFSQPQEYQFYFSNDKRLIRFDVPNQRIRVYQDLVTSTPTSEGQTPGATGLPFTEVIGHAFLYFIITALSIAILGGLRAFNVSLWLAFVLGCVAILVVPLIQRPLQTWLVQEVIVPTVRSDGNLFTAALLPAAAVAAIQELLKLSLIIGYWRRKKPSGRLVVAAGALIGAGFGLAEAIYNAYNSAAPLLGITLWERAFYILFHTATGALYGAALRMGDRFRAITFAALFFANLMLHYLPVLVQQKTLGTVPVYWLMTTIVAVTAGFSLFRGRQAAEVRSKKH